MADPTGLEKPDLEPIPPMEKALLQQGSAFSFLQAYRTLSRQVREQGGDPQRDIRIRPALSLELPRASVDRIERIETEGGQPQYEIQTSFLGLYGASSPLPNFYTEDLIAAEQEDELQARLLLDVFHQRAYRLYAAAQQKYQPVYELAEQAEPNFRKLLWSLIGARDEHTRRSMPQPALFLQYVNLYGRQQRSSAGLHFILSDYLGSVLADSRAGLTVDVEQCVEQHLDIPARDMLGLGQGKALGLNAVMGRYVPDYSGKLLIRIGGISAADYQAIVSDSHQWEGLSSLIRAYVGPTLACELEISMTARGLGGTCLGDSRWSGMGLSTWLHRPEARDVEEEPVVLVSRLRLN